MSGDRSVGACGPIDSSPELAALEALGWIRRTISDRTRVGQLEDDYRALGFETRIVMMAPDRFGDGCAACAIASAGTCLMLLTRRATPPPGAGSGRGAIGTPARSVPR